MLQFDSTQFNLLLLLIGCLVLGYGLFSRFIKVRLFLSNPILAAILGIICGPVGLGLFRLDGSQALILEQAARVAIAVQLASTALNLRSAYPFQCWRSLLVLLGPVMLGMWAISSTIVYQILDIDFGMAAIIGAAIAPTDPVLASTIVTGKFAEVHLPKRVRDLLAAESGLNDGLAYPFVLLPLLLLTRRHGEAIWHWSTAVIFWEVGAAMVLGLAGGYIAGKLLKWAQKRDLIDKQSYLAYVLALSITILGGVKLIGSDGILAVFLAGVGFDLVVGESERVEEENIQEALDLILTSTIFFVFGLAIPWQAWLQLGWSGLGLTIAILLLRRLPMVLLFQPLMPRLRHWSDAWFMGFFGPIGVAAIFYANLVVGRDRIEGIDIVWSVVSLVVAGSILVHGVSAVPLSRIYGGLMQKRGTVD